MFTTLDADDRRGVWPLSLGVLICIDFLDNKNDVFAQAVQRCGESVRFER
jgi:hypothetical protein